MSVTQHMARCMECPWVWSSLDYNSLHKLVNEHVSAVHGVGAGWMIGSTEVEPKLTIPNPSDMVRLICDCGYGWYGPESQMPISHQCSLLAHEEAQLEDAGRERKTIDVACDRIQGLSMRAAALEEENAKLRTSRNRARAGQREARRELGRIRAALAKPELSREQIAQRFAEHGGGEVSER